MTSDIDQVFSDSVNLGSNPSSPATENTDKTEPYRANRAAEFSEQSERSAHAGRTRVGTPVADGSTAARAIPPTLPRFTLADAERAHDEWGANCGPGALAAVMGMTLDEVRPHLIGFDAKGYTNPTMMFDALKSIGAKWSKVYITNPHHFPDYGLARIQWEGPWTDHGAHPKWKYRQTHWVGACARDRHNVGIFDINCMNNGAGWVSLRDWSNVIAPHLIALYPRANGRWHVTHAIEVQNDPRWSHGGRAA